MSTDLLDRDLVAEILQHGLDRGGQWVEVFCEDRAMTGASLDDQRVEELSSGRSRGAGFRVLVGDTVGFAHTADLSKASLLEAVSAAASVASTGGGGTQLARLAVASPTPPLVDILPETIGKAEKLALLQGADHAARSYAAAIAQVQVGYADSRRRILVANSDGTFATDDQVRVRFVVICTAMGDTGLQTGYQVLARTAGYEALDLQTLESKATRAAAQAVTKLSARPAPTGALPVILAAGSGGILFHEACGHGLEADAVLKDSSVYAGKVGTQVADPSVTLVDDGTLGQEWGTARIDDEGRPTGRTVLIDQGLLTDYMFDFLRSRQQGRLSTGNGRRQSYEHLPMVRMTNTNLLAGGDRAEDLIAGTDLGIYVEQLGGGQVDTATGDFVFGMTEAYLVERGEITAPLREANLIGNGPEVLRRVDGVADEFAMSPGTCGKDGQSVPVGCGAPTMRLASVTVGGTA